MNSIQRSSGTLIIITLAIIFLWFGALKFTTGGAEGIKPLIENSPLMSWVYTIFSVTSFAAILGLIEIAIGLLLLAGLAKPELGVVGALASIFTYIVTLHFMFTTPGVVPEGASFPILSGMPGEFLLKDIVLLAASIYVLGERKAAQENRDLEHLSV